MGGPGLCIDSLLGLIDVNCSSAGYHAISYTTTGPCPTTHVDSVNIINDANADFEYLSTDYCVSDITTIIPDTLPQAGVAYHFTVTPPGLSLNTANGQFIPATSTVGQYQVTIHLDSIGGACQTTKTVPVEILAPSTFTMTLSDSVFCKTDSFTEVIITPPQQGTFTGSPGLIWFDRSDTGIVAIYATQPGVHSVLFQKDGVCHETLQDSITISAPINPFFQYPQNSYCKSDSNPRPQVQNVGGVFTAVPINSSGHMSFVDSTTGMIDLLNTDPSNYTISYSSPGCAGDTGVIMVIFPSPFISIGFDPSQIICAGEVLTVTSGGADLYSMTINGDTSNIINSNSVTLDTLLYNTMVHVVGIDDATRCAGTTDSLITVRPIPDGNPLVSFPTVTGASPISFQINSNVDSTYFVWTASAVGNVTLGTLLDSTGILSAGQYGTITNTLTINGEFTPGIAIFRVVPYANGCMGAPDSVRIKINPEGLSIFIPEVFTPNGDGKNDTWQIQWNTEIVPSDYYIQVFNRSGGLVYENEGLLDTWNGGILPDGVYWFRIKESNNTTYASGGLTIRRE